MKTTLNKIRDQSPCADGWAKLLKSLNKTKADDDPVLLVQILDSNGLDDALWCLRAVTGRDKEIRLYAVWCARQVQNLMTDQHSLVALDIAESFANGKATREELYAARAAAEDATWAEAGAAARDAAWHTARYASRYAAWAATRAAAVAATGDAARDAAWAAARAAQEKEFRRLCEKCEMELLGGM